MREANEAKQGREYRWLEKKICNIAVYTHTLKRNQMSQCGIIVNYVSVKCAEKLEKQQHAPNIEKQQA